MCAAWVFNMNESDETGELHYAAGDGDIRRIELLVAQGCAVNAFDDLGFTPLHYAAREAKLDAIKVLLALGADVNAHDEKRAGNTPLAEVAGHCSFDVAKVLVEAGADPTIPGWMQLTALHRASERKKLEGLKVFELLKNAAQRPRPL